MKLEHAALFNAEFSHQMLQPAPPPSPSVPDSFLKKFNEIVEEIPLILQCFCLVVRLQPWKICSTVLLLGLKPTVLLVVVPQQWCFGHFGLLSGWLWWLIRSVVLKCWNFGKIGGITARDRIPSLIHVLCPQTLRHRVVKASVDSSPILFEKLVWDFYQSQVPPPPLHLHILHIKLSRHLPVRLVDLQVRLF